MGPPTREQAWQLLNEFTTKPGLIKHALAVEAGMRAYAPRFGGDPDVWGVVGLLHDFDYERWPTLPDHPLKGSAVLAERGYPDELIRAIQSHAPSVGVPRESPLERTLFAVDEASGFIVACALVQPGRSLAEVTPRSIRRKLKDKAFARGVDRADVEQGAADLGMPLDEHLTFLLAALQRVAADLGLAAAAD